MRSRQLVILEHKHLSGELAQGYMQEGYGILEVPDLSAVSKATADYLVSVMADEVQEFVKDGQQVIVLRSKPGGGIQSLLAKLSKRKVSVQVMQI